MSIRGGICKPSSLSDLFLAFQSLALKGFGGVYAVIHHDLVTRKKWLTNEQFLEDWALAQTVPGPNAVNMAVILGGRYFGFRGILVALAGVLSVPMLLLLCLAHFYLQVADSPHVVGAMRGMGAVAAGLAIAAGLKLAFNSKGNVLGPMVGIGLGVACFVAVAVLRWPLHYVLMALGGFACILAYRKLVKPSLKHR